MKVTRLSTCALTYQTCALQTLTRLKESEAERVTLQKRCIKSEGELVNLGVKTAELMAKFDAQAAMADKLKNLCRTLQSERHQLSTQVTHLTSAARSLVGALPQLLPPDSAVMALCNELSAASTAPQVVAPVVSQATSSSVTTAREGVEISATGSDSNSVSASVSTSDAPISSSGDVTSAVDSSVSATRAVEDAGSSPVRPRADFPTGRPDPSLSTSGNASHPSAPHTHAAATGSNVAAVAASETTGDAVAVAHDTGSTGGGSTTTTVPESPAAVHFESRVAAGSGGDAAVLATVRAALAALYSAGATPASPTPAA